MMDDEEELNLGQSCEWEWGICNDAPNHDAMSMYERGTTDMVAVAAKVAKDKAFRVEDNRDVYDGICMRVDESSNGYYEIKCRIPEIDGDRPEPVECVPKNVKSNGHFAVELHSTYRGKLDTTPEIGQIMTLKVPAKGDGQGGYQSDQCRILGATNKFVSTRSKSSKPKARTVVPNPPNTGQLQEPAGDGIGSQVMDAANQAYDAAADALETAYDFYADMFN